jgi:tripartite-type tricarboxylate transporter receptor subunit TctC
MGMFAPAATPPAMVGKLRDIFVEVARDPDFVMRISNSGGYVMTIPPQQQQQFLRREIERWGQLIRQYGVAAD